MQSLAKVDSADSCWLREEVCVLCCAGVTGRAVVSSPPLLLWVAVVTCWRESLDPLASVVVVVLVVVVVGDCLPLLAVKGSGRC